MERAKDGLSQYLDFISVIAEIPEMRHLLIEWETVYEMVALLKALEAGVARKSIDEKPVPGQPVAARRSVPAGNPTSSATNPDRPYEISMSQEPNSTHLQDTPHRFPWAGIKIQILIILTSLIAPANARRQGPGNPIVQKQLLAHEGIMPLLNCCVYDGHNEYLKERATLTIKFLMEGCKEAQDFVKELVPVKQAQAQAQAAAKAAQEAQANGSGSNETKNERPRQTAKAPPGSAPYIAKQNAIAAAKAQALAHAQSSGITLGASDVEKKMKEFERNIRSLKVGKELRDQEAEASSSANAGKEKKKEVKIEFISARK
jgi:palmitoyltransferase